MIEQIDPAIPILCAKLALKDSKIAGLKAFANGFVKEGVGAGGASIAAMLKVGINSEQLLSLTETQYENTISQ
jgi:NaMN:DMB phosphoribosyltransferase